MKKILAILLALTILIGVTACNYQVIDTTYNYEYAIVELPNGKVVEGKVESWRDYDDGDQIQVTISGNTYLVHSANAALMTKKP